MTIENKVIDNLRPTVNSKDILTVSRSIIKILDLSFSEFDSEVIIQDCLIYDWQVHSSWFREGLILKDCKIIKYVDYQMGGHNKKPIKMYGNIFSEFVNFFDCQFDGVIEVKNNIFLKGSNLFGNLGEGFANSFENGALVENNLGNLNLNGLGEALS